MTTKLTATQQSVLKIAARHEDRAIRWPDRLRGGAIKEGRRVRLAATYRTRHHRRRAEKEAWVHHHLGKDRGAGPRVSDHALNWTLDHRRRRTYFW